MTTPSEARELLKTVPLSNWQEVLRLTKIINDNDLARYKTAHATLQRRNRELEILLSDLGGDIGSGYIANPSVAAERNRNKRLAAIRALLTRKEKK